MWGMKAGEDEWINERAFHWLGNIERIPKWAYKNLPIRSTAKVN